MLTSRISLLLSVIFSTMIIAASCHSTQTPEAEQYPENETEGEIELRTRILDRARDWLVVEDGGRLDSPVIYSNEDDSGLGGYRADCSGYVSYAWNLPELGTNGGLTTYDLSLYGHSTRVEDLKPGDILVSREEFGGSTNHALIFVEWIEKESGRFVAYEENGGSYYRRATQRDDLILEECGEFSCGISGEGEGNWGPYNAYMHPEIAKAVSSAGFTLVQPVLADAPSLEEIAANSSNRGFEQCSLINPLSIDGEEPAADSQVNELPNIQIGIYESVFLQYEPENWNPVSYETLNLAGEPVTGLKSLVYEECTVEPNFGMGTPESWIKTASVRKIGNIDYQEERWIEGSTGEITLIVFQNPPGDVGVGRRFEVHPGISQQECIMAAEDVIRESEYLIWSNTPAIELPSDGDVADFGPDRLIGSWEGTVTGSSEGAGPYTDARQIQIVAECPAGGPCIVFSPYTDTGPIPLVDISGEGYCFNDQIVHLFCFAFIDDNTIEYRGSGGLWGEDGVLRRIEAGSNQYQIGPEAAWDAPSNAIPVLQDCLFRASSVEDCMEEAMESRGARSEAIDFARILDWQAILVSFTDYGTVDIGIVFYPTRANNNWQLVMLNGLPSIVFAEDAWDLELDQAPGYETLPGSRAELIMWASEQTLEASQTLVDGGQRFVFSHPLYKGCHACGIGGYALSSFDFDSSGQFIGRTLLGVGSSKPAVPAP